MYLADYHTHTQFSPDAHDPMTVMAQAALDAGMDEICFTDHVEPLTWGSNELRPPYDWSGLTASTLITILCGLRRADSGTASICGWAWRWATRRRPRPT